MPEHRLDARRRYRPDEQPVLDRYTWGHAAVGVLYGLGELPWPAVAALAVGWEVIENPLKDALPQIFPDAHHDRYANAAADAAAVMLAYALTRRLTR